MAVGVRLLQAAALAAMLLLAACAGGPARSGTAAATPSELYPGLFERVALSGVIPPKDWVDVRPRTTPAEILDAFRAEDPQGDAALADFVAAHFILPQADETEPALAEGRTLAEHIEALWPHLTRDARAAPVGGSLIALPHDYIVPGGRFREVYYWDAYFTMTGLGDAQAAVMTAMVDNFAWLIKTYGFVPNANRTYYLSRSQPPFFHKMVGLLAPENEARAFADYIDALKAEHAFWMDGEDELEPGKARGRVVMLADGAVLNRYWDARDIPRDESFPQDMATASEADRPAPEVWRDLRAAAESGWDFSSRWMADRKTLGSTQTTRIVPADLNSILYGLERAIAKGCDAAGDDACAGDYRARAALRSAAMKRLLWNDALGAFDDYDFAAGALKNNVSAAALYPLFFRIAEQEQAQRTARFAETRLLAPGGLLTSPHETGEQWDAPNGWAPLHWIAVQGFSAYGEADLAETVAERWLATVARTFCETGKLVEKYDVVVARPGGGGEYPLQDGFGWTNGVTAALLEMYPALSDHGEVRAPPAGLSPEQAEARCAAALP